MVAHNHGLRPIRKNAPADERCRWCGVQITEDNDWDGRCLNFIYSLDDGDDELRDQKTFCTLLHWDL